MEWNDLDINRITRMDLSCIKCSALNIKIKGEDLNCDFCGKDLFELEEASE